MMQNCYVNVDEKGTKAVACSLVRGGGTAESYQRFQSFIADHPFLFMVRGDTSGAVLFMGAVLNPALVG